MKARNIFTAAFAAAVLAACSESPKEAAQRQKEEASTLAKLAQADTGLFRQAGFEIVARIGMGECNSRNEIHYSRYYGKATDMAYVLKKPGAGDMTYTACVSHSYNGGAVVRGLQSVEKFTPGPK
jgi:hypothetical protein